jgi:L-threonylcarbamoyladenylate synthase
MRRVQRIDPARPDAAHISRAADLLRAGQLVAYPTETFYGLAGNPRDGAALDRVFQAKGRPDRMALPLIAADPEAAVTCFRHFPESARKLAAAFWPGPLTLVLPAADDLPRRLLGGGSTVGIRVSSHPVALALARAAGGPIIATSANRSGQPPPQSAAEVEQALGQDVSLILDGGVTRGGPASTVLDLAADPPRVVRSGAVPLSELERVLGRRLP